MEDKTDSYERKLLEVFQSCDTDSSGRLDSTALSLLCHKLQLEDQGPVLVEQLLKSDPTATVSFQEFKEGLVALLAQGPALDDLKREHVSSEESPEREVTPKFVFGKKKYGRRSRPESAEDKNAGVEVEVMDNDVFLTHPTTSKDSSEVPLAEEKDQAVMLQRCKKQLRTSLDQDCGSNSSSKRSLSGTSSQSSDSAPSSSPPSLGENEEEYLLGIWNKLGVGKDGYLDQSELACVCECIGMGKVAEEVIHQLFEQLDVDQDGRISFEEFLHLFRSAPHHGISMLETPDTPGAHSILDGPNFSLRLNTHMEHQSSFSSVPGPECGMFSMLDPDNSGFATTESVLELWDTLGNTSASKLLKDLGHVSSKRLNLQDLSISMEEELQNLGEAEKPPVLQAALITYRSEVHHLRSVLESVQKERDKLRLDIGEANQRSLLLAQEVDDQNARLEKSSQLQIRHLEQKHAEQLRQVQEQFALEREQIQQQHQLAVQKLEKQLESLREEETALRKSLEAKEQENQRLEQENITLGEHLEDAKRQQSHFQRELETIGDLRKRLADLECSSDLLLEEQYQRLLKQVQKLSSENKDLKDSNDELELQIEALSSRLINGKRISDQPGQLEPEQEQSSDQATVCGTKRRGSTSLHLLNESWSDLDSPRVGKLRKRTLDLSLQAADSEAESENTSLTDIILEIPEIGSSKESSADEEEVDGIRKSRAGTQLDEKTPSVESLQLRISQLEKEIEEEKKKVQKCEEEKASLSGMSLANTQEISSVLEGEACSAQTNDLGCQLKKIFHHLRNQLVSEIGDSACPYCDKPLLTVSPHTSAHNSMGVKDEDVEIQEGMTKSQAVSQTEKAEVLKSRVAELETRCADLSQLQKVMEAEYEMEIHKLKDKCTSESASPHSSFSRNSKEEKKSGSLEMRLEVALDELQMSLKREEQEKAKKKEFKTRCHELEEKLSMVMAARESNSSAASSIQEHRVVDLEYSNNLELELEEMKREIVRLMSEKECLIQEKEGCCSNKLHSASETNENEELTEMRKALEELTLCLDEERQRFEQEKAELKEKCLNYENSLELLRVEYEKCEDYWQNKLDEERDIYDRDRQMTNDRFQALEIKIKEYEEMFNQPDVSDSSDGLSTIEERASLEKQVTDLEEECEELRKQVEQSHIDQDSIVRSVQTQMQRRLEQEKNSLEQQVVILQQKCAEYEQRLSALSRDESIGGIIPMQNVEIEEELATLRQNCQDLSSQLQAQAENHTRSLEEKEKSWKDKLEKQRKDMQEFFSKPLPSSVGSGRAKLQLQVGSSWSCQVEMSVLQALNSRIQQQEQRCHHLQMALKRQQQQMEKILLDTQKQHQDEILNLEAIMRATQEMLRQQTNRYREQLDKLACSDILIKELYVENAGLVKSLQVTEQKLRMAQNHHNHLHHHCQGGFEDKGSGAMVV